MSSEFWREQTTFSKQREGVGGEGDLWFEKLITRGSPLPGFL